MPWSKFNREGISWRGFVKFATWYVVDTLVMMRPAAKTGMRTMIVRLDNIGDFVIWLDAAQRLARYYKDLGNETILIASGEWAEWANSLALFDQVLAVDRKRYSFDLRYRFQIGVRIRKLGCVTAILPVYSRNWGSGDAIIRISGAKTRIGSHGDVPARPGLEGRVGDSWFTELVPAAPVKMTEFERNAEFLQFVLRKQVLAEVGDLRALQAKLPDRSEAASFKVPGEYYVLFPGASDGMKCWPASHFQEIARRVYERTGWTGVICGGPGDKQSADEVNKGGNLSLINLAGQTTLASLTDLLSGARLLVSNDTSAVHIAAALSVPTVCILGGGHFGRFLPYPRTETHRGVLPAVVSHPMSCFDCNWECIYDVPPGEPSPCISRVEIEHVWREVDGIIAISERG